MPVSYFPCVLPLLLVVAPLLCVLRGKKPFLIAAAISSAVLMLILLAFYVPGWILMVQARDGSPETQYELARWHENHCEAIQEWLLWPCEPDVLTGYAWLETAAQQDYPLAVYTLGVRLKYGDHVPRPANWTGPGGNVFAQPARGQALIDRALQLGYRPQTAEEMHYLTVYRAKK
jgi:TPR repeat protein